MDNKNPGKSWDGWYFEDDYFCSPEGDRYHEESIRACFFYKQMREVSNLLFKRPEWDD